MIRFLVAVLLMLPTLPVHAAGSESIFGEGSTQFSLIGGGGSALNSNYFVLGGGAGYYLRDGLEVGLTFEKWSGSPPITKYAPFVQYVFLRDSLVLPYVGGFIKHNSFDGLPGINSVGVRVGIYVPASPNAYLGVGIVQENYLNCRESVYLSCSATYPDLSFIFAY